MVKISQTAGTRILQDWQENLLSPIAARKGRRSILMSRKVGDEEKPAQCSCSRSCFLRFSKKQVIADYRLNLAEFTKEEKGILLLTKLEQMEHSGGRNKTGEKNLSTLRILLSRATYL